MRRYLAIMSWIVAIMFATISLFLPPKGKVDSSVLVLVAQLLVMTATFLGVEGYVNLIRKIKN